MPLGIYQDDLAYIHAAGFSALARGAAPEIVRRLRSAPTQVRRVLDVGCGAGPLSAALVDAGFEVTGLDPSTELLALARVAAPRAHFIQASVYEAGLPACDAIVALGEPLTYHEEAADADALLWAFFRRAAGALPAGGLLIFDIIEVGAPSLAGRTWASGEDWAVLSETQEDQAARTLIRGIETFRRVGEHYRRGSEVHYVRLFEKAALAEQLAACGFSVETAQSYGAQPLPARRRAFFCMRL